ncbi:MAG TPA: hypothetical protein PLW09_13050 [Candidatus Kapabacteria bacterium]|nr:hypothetical protein [Candidatus Kapabacteria bacterium]
MKLIFNVSKEQKAVSILFLFFALSITFFMTRSQYMPNINEKYHRHYAVIHHNADNLYNYRILPSLATELLRQPLSIFIHNTTQSFLIATIVWSILVYFCTQWAMFCFFRQTGLDYISAFVGVMLWVIILPQSLTGWDESGDILNLCFFALVSKNFLEGNIVRSIVPLFLSAWNKEQTLLLPVFYFIGTVFAEKNTKKVFLNTLYIAFVIVSSTVLLHIFVGSHSSSTLSSSYLGTDYLYNIQHPEWILTWLLSLGVFVFFAIPSLEQSLPFLRYNLMFTLPVFYVLVFFVRARMREIDKAFILHLFLIPLAMQTLRQIFLAFLTKKTKH